MRPTTSPQDIRGMFAANGIVTARGGALSHAAVVSRALDKPCVVGCEELSIDLDARTFAVQGATYDEGEALSLDGATGRIYLGRIPFGSIASETGEVRRLVRAADRASGCACWLSTVAVGDARHALADEPAGVGPLSLTDVLIGSGRLDDLIAGIDDVSRDPHRSETQHRLTGLAHEAAAAVLRETTAFPVHVRLPNLGSPRAQRMISTWAGLAPRLFLPLGLRAFYRPLVEGVAAAAAETGHPDVTIVVGGVTDEREVEAMRVLVETQGALKVGASLTSPAGLRLAPVLAEGGFAVWIQIPEIIRTFYGFPSALSLADDVFESYVEDGFIPVNPRHSLAPDLKRRLAEAAASPRVGVECGDGAAYGLVAELHAAGFRTFSLAPSQLAPCRVLLGQSKMEVRV